MLNDTEWRAYLALQDAGPLLHPEPVPEPAPWEQGGQAQIDEQDAAAPEVRALCLLLEGRRSSRELWNPLHISDLRQTLCLALTSTRRPPLRPYPTSGGCDELGVLLAARKVRGLEEGAYWVVADGGISFLRAASLDEGFAEFERQAIPFLGISTERPPAVSLFIMADWRRLCARYENCILASALWDCGAVYQTLLLAASAVGLNACVSACVRPRLVQAWLQLDHREIGHIGTVALGGSLPEETGWYSKQRYTLPLDLLFQVWYNISISRQKGGGSVERSFDTAHFAARVKRRRGPASLRAAAAELGTSASTLDRIERGVLVPDVEFFLWLCAWMEASPQEFFLSQDDAEADAVHLVERALRRDGILDPELIEALTTLLALLYKRRSW